MSERSGLIIGGRAFREAAVERSGVGGMSERSELIIGGRAFREAAAERSEVGA
ncbi:hypothetical protein ACIRRH_32525 [Kitasatospora sp. NPDC101235]|uniref:hypothetical protein n=1 Tax=Kitasatospora sp. NPDC101235 TaxID=3364101 RepID=UPI00380F7C95